MSNNPDIPLRETMCNTCPFREGSKYSYLKDELTKLSHKEGRICHSTGKDNAINKRTGFPEHLCRGSRNVQLEYMHKLQVIDSPTDEAWDDAREMHGMKRTVIKDPEEKTK